MKTTNINSISRAAILLLATFSIMFAAGCDPADNSNGSGTATPSPAVASSPTAPSESTPASSPSPAVTPSPAASPSPKAKTPEKK